LESRQEAFEECALSREKIGVRRKVGRFVISKIAILKLF
jgi:hypothetical protein